MNIAKGRTVEYYNKIKSNEVADSGFTLVLLKVAEVDDTLNNHATLADLISGGNTEADFTNYVRKDLTDADLAALPAPDDANNYITLDLPDATWTSAGGVTDNTLVKVIVCYNPAVSLPVDANTIPVAHFDFATTTNGADLTMQVNASGFYRAT